MEQTSHPDPSGILKLAEIGCKIHAEHVALICRLTDKGICPRCLESLAECGWCHFTKLA